MFDFNGKTVIITGGTSGIGAKAVEMFDAAGAKVFFSGQNKERAEKVVAACSRNVRFIAADVSKEKDVLAFFQHVDEETDRIDVLFNNAGVLHIAHSQVTELEIGEWNQLFAVNQTSVYLHMKEAINRMKPHHSGAIINNASIMGNVRFNGKSAAYSASKAGIIALTKCTAIGYAAEGIRVNSVSPGVTKTSQTLYAFGGEDGLEKKSKELPRGSAGIPEEVVNVVMFLASDYASYVSGVDIVVDGASTLR